MSRTVVIPLAISSGRMNSRLPFGSRRSGQVQMGVDQPRNQEFPGAVDDLAVLRESWPSQKARSRRSFSPSITTVMSRCTGEPVASITFTWVMAIGGVARFAASESNPRTTGRGEHSIHSEFRTCVHGQAWMRHPPQWT